jgi:nucleoside-diphosphate-sugar epimerase
MLSHINVGAGEDISIADLARLVAEIAGFQGRIRFDASKPDGTPRKLMDVSRLKAMGWSSRIGLLDGLRETYAWFQDNLASVRKGQ